MGGGARTAPRVLVADEAGGQRAGALAILEGLHAVLVRGLVSLHGLHPARCASGQIVLECRQDDLELLVVNNVDVSKLADNNLAAVEQACTHTEATLSSSRPAKEGKQRAIFPEQPPSSAPRVIRAPDNTVKQMSKSV